LDETPLNTYLSLGFSGLVVSIVPSLVALFSGAKTLGWDTQKNLKMILKTLGRFGLAQV
jgi:hypothetical protein